MSPTQSELPPYEIKGSVMPVIGTRLATTAMFTHAWKQSHMVIPMASSYVGRELLRMGGRPALRENYKTDNGNLILDCHALTLLDPPKTESDRECPHGVQFYDVVLDGVRHDRAAWSYEAPRPAMQSVGGRFGFWKDVAVR